MKLSLATPTVLLSATAVQAFPRASVNTTTTRLPSWGPIRTITPDSTPSTTTTLEVPSTPVPVARHTSENDIAAQVTGLIQSAKVPDDDWEEKEKLLRSLEENRKVITERLLEAQVAQQSAEVRLQTEQNKVDTALSKTLQVKEDLDELKKEQLELEKSLNSTLGELKEAKHAQGQARGQYWKALTARRDAVAEVKELREAIEKLDEAIKSIGSPED